ncbi:hypothetical protein EOL70_16655 [Leucothrix sargassi]|nr:hypothetical protein EOL70_16655 [Leucothrix sargassi]
MESAAVSTHTLFHHYIRELKNAKEVIAQTKKYLDPSSPNYLERYIENLEKLQASGQDQSHKLATAKKHLQSYTERAAQAQDILDNHPKKLSFLTGNNDVFLAPPERQKECLYVLDEKTCQASCNDWESDEVVSDTTVLFTGKQDIALTEDEQTDAVRVWHHNVLVSNLSISDQRQYTEAHRDAIQLIPPALHKEINGVKRRIGDQLAGTVLNDVCIRNCKISAPNGPLQGIFASDGMHRNLRIINNDIETLGSHTISIAGLLTGGVISGNTLRQVKGGERPKIRLYPARIGGNMAEDGVVTILSFADSNATHYAPVDKGEGNALVLADGSTEHLEVTDLRGEIPSNIEHMSLGLHDFDYDAYLEEFSTTTFVEYIEADPVGALQLQAWLRLRIDEYTNGRAKGHVLGQPSHEQQHIAKNDLIPALEILRSGELNSIYISEIRQTAIRSFIMKRIAMKHGKLAPLRDLAGRNEKRDLTLRFLLAV